MFLTHSLCTCKHKIVIMSSGDTYLLFDQLSPDLFTGCPFRHTDADLLRQRLAAYRIPKKGIDEVQLKAITEKRVLFEYCHNVFKQSSSLQTGVLRCNSSYCTILVSSSFTDNGVCQRVPLPAGLYKIL